MPCAPGMTKCRPLCLHRELVQNYHVARNAYIRYSESLRGQPVEAVTFKQWLIANRTPEEWK